MQVSHKQVELLCSPTQCQYALLVLFLFGYSFAFNATLPWVQLPSMVMRCPYGVNQVQTTNLCIEYQLVIEAEVNTPIIINEGITIDVTNASTNLFIHTIGTST
jgi:hypothetical protein